MHTGGFAGGVIFGGGAAWATTKALTLTATKGLGLAATTTLISIGPKGWILLGCIIAISGAVGMVVGNRGGEWGEQRGDAIHSSWLQVRR